MLWLCRKLIIRMFMFNYLGITYLCILLSNGPAWSTYKNACWKEKWEWESRYGNIKPKWGYIVFMNHFSNFSSCLKIFMIKSGSVLPHENSGMDTDTSSGHLSSASWTPSVAAHVFLLPPSPSGPGPCTREYCIL